MTPYKIKKIFDLFSTYIDPKSDLEYSNNFQLLVAVVLSAQATDKGVNNVTREFFPYAKKPQDILDIGHKNFEKIISRIGLYKAKAKNVLATCQILVDKYNSIIPETREELMELPGVGRKTANVVLNIAFDQPTLAVDTHIFRVSNRMKFVSEKTPDKVELAMLKIIPKKHLKHAHHYLILHGRYTCVARKPRCEICQVRKYCDFEEKIID